MDQLAKKRTKKKATIGDKNPAWYNFTKWLLSILGAVVAPVLTFLLLFVVFAVIFSADDGFSSLDANVAVIPLKGAIVADKSSAGFGFDGTVSTDFIKMIKKAEEDDNIHAVIFEINSPGGSAVASAEVAAAIKDMKKPTVAVIREVGASGAFWAASAADKVYAHPLSIAGSIGVISSYVEIAGLLERYNMTYRRLVSGNLKDAGSPLKKMTAEEQELFENRLSEIHKVFISSVAENRKLSYDEVASVADGFVFLGTEAKELGFVDDLGGMKDAKEYLSAELNMTVETVNYKVKGSFFDQLAGVSAQPFYAIGRGISDGVTTSGSSGLPQLVYS